MAFATTSWKCLKPFHKYNNFIAYLRKSLTDEKYEVGIVRQGEKKILPSKLQFDHHNCENKEVNTLKRDRRDSMSYLTPNFFHD